MISLLPASLCKAAPRTTVVTDGESTNAAALTQQAAQAQKTKGITMIGIGVGQDANAVELQGIASEPKADHWTMLDDYQSLPALAQLLAASCIPRIPDGANRTWGVCPHPCEGSTT